MSYRNQPEEIQRSYAQVAVAPVHLKGAEAIGVAFNVTTASVYRWRRMGAPIARVNKHYQAEFNALMAWLTGRGER